MRNFKEYASDVCKVCGQTPCNCTTVSEGENKQIKGGDPCWKGYQMVGMKSKGGKKVPNCVPATNEEGVAEGAPIVVMPRADRLKKPEPIEVRYQGDIIPPTKPPSTEKRGVKGRPGQRPMPKYEEQVVAEGLGKSIKRGMAGWGAFDKDKPADVVKRVKGQDTDTLKRLSRTGPTGRGSPAELQQKAISRELKKRGEQGVSEGTDQLNEYPEDLKKMKKADSYKVGDKVMVKAGGKWNAATITKAKNAQGNYGVRLTKAGVAYLASTDELRLMIEALKPGWMLKKDPKLGAAVKAKQDLAKKRQASYGNPAAGKSVKESLKADVKAFRTMIEEASYKVDVEGLPTMYVTSTSPTEVKTNLRKILKKADMIKSVDRIPDVEVKKAFRLKAMGKDEE